MQAREKTVVVFEMKKNAQNLIQEIKLRLKVESTDLLISAMAELILEYQKVLVCWFINAPYNLKKMWNSCFH